MDGKQGGDPAKLADALVHLAGLGLLEYRNDLLFAESGLLHRSSPVGKLYYPAVLNVGGLQYDPVRQIVDVQSESSPLADGLGRPLVIGMIQFFSLLVRSRIVVAIRIKLGTGWS
jgi:hypothetical protein